MIQLTDSVKQYLETALWSSTGDDEEPLDSAAYADTTISDELWTKATGDCNVFMQKAGAMIDEHDDPTMWAHDFWLTRNGHGAGFWDGDWPINGDALTALAKSFGGVDLYVGDDRKIYQM